MKVRVRAASELKLTNSTCSTTRSEDDTHYKGKWGYDYYPDRDLHPETYSNIVKEIDYWIVDDVGVDRGIYLNGNFFRFGTTLRASVNVPAQDDDKWSKF